MSQSKLLETTYYDPKVGIRLTAYADTIIIEQTPNGGKLCAIRFGGYPEVVQAMSDAIYSGVTIEVQQAQNTIRLNSAEKHYQRQITHNGPYAVATMMISDDVQELRQNADDSDEDEPEAKEVKAHQPRKCYIFCAAGDRKKLFEEVDRKTAAPMISEFQDYVLDALINLGYLRQLEVFSLKKDMDAWTLSLLPEDKNVVEILEQGLRDRSISIPGAVPGMPSGFKDIYTVTNYLNAFGTVVAERIRTQFTPLFDPASEPLSEEILEVNGYIQERAGYSLYDAQLAVAEATKRQLKRTRTAIICAECGSGKTKIGATALGALYAEKAQHQTTPYKTFNLVMCPSHITKKWVREIGETLPNAYGMVVKSITDINRLYSLYEQGQQSVYAVFSKEKARDGYMRYPAVTWNRRKRAFLCPDCIEPIEMPISDDGSRYMVNADQFFFQREHKENRQCPNCGSPLWAPVNPSMKLDWIKIGGYGWIYRDQAVQHLARTENEVVLERIKQIIDAPDGCYPVKGAVRRYPLSTYIKKKMKGKINGFICDELHEYNNDSGQGDAMAELFGVTKYCVGMTATLINGYSSGIFHLLYRMMPSLMRKDRKVFRRPSDFDAEYGVVENQYETRDAAYNAKRRASKRKTKSRQLPGVSPLVYSRFLLEYTSFLSLLDMGKDLPDYEEIPIPLRMPEDVEAAYKAVEQDLREVLRSNKAAAKKIQSAYLNLLTVYPDQPYDQPEIKNPIDGHIIAAPENVGDFERVYPKEEKTMEIVRKKIANGERVIIYTSWTRTDSQQKLLKLLNEDGIKAEVLTPKIPPEKREAWVEKRVQNGLQVLITNPRCVETGLDLNAFTTLIFYSLGYNLFTLRQASRRSWRINQTAPRIEVYLLYYADTMQAKAIKLMASKLAVAGLIEGTFTDEGLAAMSDVKDLTSQMAKELALGIKDNVDDIAASFKRMAIINPNRTISQPTNAESKEQAVEVTTGNSIRETEAAVKRAMYEGLIEKAMNEPTKRRKKTIIDENQENFFDLLDSVA